MTQIAVYGIGRAKSPKERMRWLLQFAGSDLNSLTPGEQLDLWLDVQYFHIPFFHRIPQETTVKSLPDKGLEKLRQLQSELREGLQAIRIGGSWRLPATPAKWEVKVSLQRGNTYTHYRGDYRQMFFAGVADLLHDAWSLVRECRNPDCKSLFVPNRKQTYCRPECSTKVRWERYVAKGRKRDYHKEYKRSVEKKLNRKVKVRPKKPKKKMEGRK